MLRIYWVCLNLMLGSAARGKLACHFGDDIVGAGRLIGKGSRMLYFGSGRDNL
jgi:hypothetical protein